MSSCFILQLCHVVLNTFQAQSSKVPAEALLSTLEVIIYITTYVLAKASQGNMFLLKHFGMAYLYTASDPLLFLNLFLPTI